MTDRSALVRRLERLEAESAIARLSSDYCRGADTRDLNLFMSVWSTDAVWRVRDDLAFSGPNEIRSGIERQWATTLRGFHWTSNPSIDVDAEGLTARARFDVHSQTQLSDESWLSVAGAYRDEYRKIDGDWKLTIRVAEVHSQRAI